MMSNVLLRLGDPRAQSVGDAQLLQQVCSQTRTVLRAKRNSGNPWNFADTDVVTVPNETLYQITAPDFGTPLSVLTKNDYANPNFIVRRIPFYLAQDLNTVEYDLPQNAGIWYGGYLFSAFDPNHVALRCSFTWRNNVPYIEFIPFGNQQATYTIRYLQSASGVNQMALAQEPVPAEDADLIEIRAAKSLLPLAQWEGNNEAVNTVKRTQLYQSLADDERLAKEQFDAANLVVEGPSTRVRAFNPCVG
jgi:hypothetical protein